jgi:hypothetical protein
VLLMADLRTPLVRLGRGPARREVLSRWIRWFVAATITYNVIEVSSAAAVAWQFAGRDPEARVASALVLIPVSTAKVGDNRCADRGRPAE